MRRRVFTCASRAVPAVDDVDEYDGEMIVVDADDGANASHEVDARRRMDATVFIVRVRLCCPCRLSGIGRKMACDGPAGNDVGVW
jgi:hypothetical protein